MVSYDVAIQRAIDYIEARLLEEITAEEVAASVGFSTYHFHRLIRQATKVSVAEYVRKRRLTHAANELLRSDAGILDIAVKYRFESQESFTRAFKTMFLAPPGAFRKQPAAKEMYRLVRKRTIDAPLLRHLQAGISAEPAYVLMDALLALAGGMPTSFPHESPAGQAESISVLPDERIAVRTGRVYADVRGNRRFYVSACVGAAIASPLAVKRTR